MSIVTKTGDGGMTGLFGGQRVRKDSLRIDAYGTVDELNAVLGVVLCQRDVSSDLRDKLTAIQHMLFSVAGDLATPLGVHEKQKRIAEEDVACLEEEIHYIEAGLEPQHSFILPGGSAVASHLHLARTVCRRAERVLVALAAVEEVNPCTQTFLNRLSDYFFVLARSVNAGSGVPDTEVRY